MFNKSLLEIKFKNLLVEVYGLMLNILDHPSHSFPESVSPLYFFKKQICNSFLLYFVRKEVKDGY